MINIQQEAKLLQEQRVQNVITKIESDLLEDKRFSFHHYATKFDIPVNLIQDGWAKHFHNKKGR